MDKIIRVENLGKKYRRYSSVAEGVKEVLHPFRKKYHKEFWALRDLSFDIKRGESVGIVGRNGSGKSTLLQVLCGILQPTEGKVEVGGKVAALLELGAGFHPQFTGRENIYLNGALMGLSRREIDKRFQGIADFADIGDFIDQPVRTYSSGMFVRLAFASAINVDADILVVDEALAVGDMFFQAKCMQKIKSLMDSGVTILFVTHDINSVKALCTKCLYLNKGIMKAFGASNKVIDSYMRERSGELKKLDDKPYVRSHNPVVDDLETVTGLFKENPEFMKQVEGTRHGTGEARITEVELLDTAGNSVEEVEFNEEVTVRIHVRFEKEEEAAVAYLIRDDKFIPILGSSTLLESDEMLHGHPGDRYVVDFRTRLPLMDGNYNIVARLAKPLIPNRSASFVDSIENARVFRVHERTPRKVWTRVLVANDMRIRKEASA